MKFPKLDKKGFTLLELIVVIGIIGLVITTILSILIFGYDVYGKTTNEFTLQSQVKLSMEQISTMVRDSRAVFAVPDTGYYDAEWNYIAVSDDGRTIESHVWNPTLNSHVVSVLVGPFEDITFNIGFDKENSMSKDNTLRMYYEAYTNEGTIKRFDIKSGYEALNALQVVDYGTVDNPATVLAYRSDDFAYENFNLVVNIALVLDVSGSMGASLSNSTRIQILREKSNELIQQFSQNTNDDVSIYMSLVPFSFHANETTEFYNVKQASSRNLLINRVNGLRASGNTNTGDGLRRAYHQLVNKQAQDLNDATEDTIIKNYTIILVDGQSNTHSERAQLRRSCFLFWCSNSWNNGSFLTEDGDVVSDGISGSNNSWYNIYYNSSSTTNANNYVNTTGAMISDDEMFTNYLIAFSNDVEASEIQLIANATNTPEERQFWAADDNQLGLSFTDIQLSITNDLWHFLGPNLVNPEE